MGEQELTERRHAEETNLLLLQKISGKQLNVHHHHHHHTRLLPKFFIKTRGGKRSSVLCLGILNNFLSNHKLILHIFTSMLLLGYLASNFNYLMFKIRLYYKELPTALGTPWLVLVLGCEVLYFMCGIIAAVDYLVPPTVAKPPSHIKPMLHKLSSFEDYDSKSDLVASKKYPTVHVMIPCCKEPTEVPQESVLAALALHYPKDHFKVFVLDDGGDDDLKAFCDAIRVESGSDQLVYLRRKKIPGVPHNFKCGNMNFGLQHSDAEYIVMMDADMILHPSFLNRILPHIVNSPNVSFVQIPQSFYNLPIGDPLNDACGFGYDRVMVHRNTLGCATCVGTGALFKRKHLDEIGGFQPQSITEDTMTAYTLFNRGYRSAYVNEKLQIGLTPWSFEAFVKQRQRWGQGALQQFAATWRIMLGRRSKLNILQKFCYFWHTGFYYMSILNIILVTTLWAALAFRLNLVIGDEEENQTLLSYLAVYLIVWRVFWYVIWIEVPQPIQSRNRDESQFWWMTPFFFQMIVDAAFNFKSTFKFVPTSNIDRSAAAGKAKQQPWMKKLNDLKHVQVHIAFIILGITTILVRTYITLSRYGIDDCREVLMVVGLSMFLLSVCAHMSVPVFHILWPTGVRPEQRKSLLKFNADGAPIFDPTKTAPKWHPSLILFELLSWINIAFWSLIYWSVHTHAYARYCPARPTSLFEPSIFRGDLHDC
ncbi:hypothetical protein GOP47_0000635 [Adiantum capillus-veneris]|uniref:Glycosyltransferase 2-like domain-containing protein n=1 Tax=Adiantum capillus-veneris TaxID=13818 RepID=A0A9D4VDC7_ADICA|nr:hypothetical protein GOP47_0000635 [Adiantum capillus-veneris]